MTRRKRRTRSNEITDVEESKGEDEVKNEKTTARRQTRRISRRPKRRRRLMSKKIHTFMFCKLSVFILHANQR